MRTYLETLGQLALCAAGGMVYKYGDFWHGTAAGLLWVVAICWAYIEGASRR